MWKRRKARVLTRERLSDYEFFLREQEKAGNTVKKYMQSLASLRSHLAGAPITKAALIEWKEELVREYAPASVNAMIAAVNSFLNFMEWTGCRIQPLKIQRATFRREEKELTRSEYARLVKTAEKMGKERLALVLQTITSTGIRVSELQFITMEAVRCGRAVVRCKGKSREVFLPKKLCRCLDAYMREQKRRSGLVFVTKSGKKLDRSNIWREMKSLCEEAGVSAEKVFPHNLRHLFARTYYSLEKDLSRLADILGHTSVATTRIYTAESGAIHRAQLERMGMIIT